MFEGGRDVGLKVAAQLVNYDKIKHYIQGDNKTTIRLTFPNLDFGVSSNPDGGNENHLRQYWDEDAFRPFQGEVGALVPHLLID